jgi:hypothetical protein
MQELMSERTKAVVAPLLAILNESLRFARMQEQLYSRALAEVGLQAKFRKAVDTRCGGCSASQSHVLSGVA